MLWTLVTGGAGGRFLLLSSHFLISFCIAFMQGGIVILQTPHYLFHWLGARFTLSCILCTVFNDLVMRYTEVHVSTFTCHADSCTGLKLLRPSFCVVVSILYQKCCNMTLGSHAQYCNSITWCNCNPLNTALHISFCVYVLYITKWWSLCRMFVKTTIAVPYTDAMEMWGRRGARRRKEKKEGRSKEETTVEKLDNVDLALLQAFVACSKGKVEKCIV